MFSPLAFDRPSSSPLRTQPLGLQQPNASPTHVPPSSPQGVHCVAYSPLGGQGSLFPNDLKERDAVARVARETGKSAAQVLLKWNLQRGVAIIPKASSEAHLRENLAGCFEWRLSNEHKVQTGRGGGRGCSRQP